jgi:hypothetical protein
MFICSPVPVWRLSRRKSNGQSQGFDCENHLDINPRDKILIDAVLDVSYREDARRAAVKGSLIGIAGIASMLLVYIEWLPGWLRITLLICGGIAVLVSLVSLSRTELGKQIADGFRGGDL